MKISCCDLKGIPIKYLYQWDLNQKIVIQGVDVNPPPEFHFCNANGNCALVVSPKVDIERLIVSVPNILLQESGSIFIYVYEEDMLTGSRTTHSISIPVRSRAKPCDYVFTENITYKSELIDIRTGWDGTVYNSAGDAVRALGSQKLDKAPIPMANEKDTQEIHRTKEGLLVTKPSSGGGGPLIKDAKIGQLIRAKAVDETGNITEYEPVPFMYEDAQETVIFPEQTVNGFEDGGADEGNTWWLIKDPTGAYKLIEEMANGSRPIAPITVVWDNISYICTPYIDEYDIYLGNSSILDYGVDTKEPFYLGMPGPVASWVTKDTGSSHTIGISTKASMSVPIPPNFLGDAEPVDSSILQVLNGKPTWAKPTLFVSFERDLNAEDVRYVADKSYEEIQNALLNDIVVIGLYRGMDYCNYYMGNFITGEDSVDIIGFSYIDAFANCIRYLIYSETTNSWRKKKLKILDSSKGLPYYDSAEDGAILQVVNGIPTWVKLTNRAEVGG